MTHTTKSDQRVEEDGWDYDAFSSRLIIAMKGKSQYRFAKDCGFGESVIRGYLNGTSIPGTKKLIAMAKAADVTIDWLATGEGAMLHNRVEEENNGYLVKSKGNSGISPEEAQEKYFQEKKTEFGKKMHDYKDATVEIGYSPPILIREAIKTVMFMQGLTKAGAIVILNAMKEQENMDKE